MTRDILHRFVDTLDPELKQVFHTIDRYIMEAPNTIERGFQMASQLMDVFTKEAESKLEEERRFHQ